MRSWTLTLLIINLIISPAQSLEAPIENNQICVILLHGLNRSSRSMWLMEYYLRFQEFKVINIDYPSRDAPIEVLAPKAINEGILRCQGTPHIAFVTHSMGGILVREYYRYSFRPRPYAVVMLAPPNKGSEIIDNEYYLDEIGEFMGPASYELSAKPNSYVNHLPPVDYPTGIIAGNQSINPITTAIIPGDDDGAVSIESTKVKGMTDHIIVNSNHTLITAYNVSFEQVQYFLENLKFDN